MVSVTTEQVLCLLLLVSYIAIQNKIQYDILKFFEIFIFIKYQLIRERTIGTIFDSSPASFVFQRGVGALYEATGKNIWLTSIFAILLFSMFGYLLVFYPLIHGKTINEEFYDNLTHKNVS